MGFGEDEGFEAAQAAAEFAKDRSGKVMQHQAAHSHAAARGIQGVEKIPCEPIDARRERWGLGDEIQAGDVAFRQRVLEAFAEVARARAEFDNALAGMGGSSHGARDPAGIAHERVDDCEVAPAAHGTRVPVVQRVEDFRSDDTFGRTHWLQWQTLEDSGKNSKFMSSVIYLDNNATTQVAPEVFEAMVPWLRDGYGNPSSVYRLGRQASAALDVARARVAALAGCQEGEIIFTSCGTESINTAILSALALDPDKRHIVTSAVEHSATVKLCEHLAQRGYEITWLPVDSDGLLDPAELENAITEETAIVTLLWANNETGVIFPVEDISAITRRKKTVLHLDAVQAFGKVPIDVERLGVEFVSFSGHKIYAPKGVGALYASRRIRYSPLLRGSQEEGRRGGTQNVASIVAFGKAAEMARASLGDVTVKELRDRLEGHLLAAIPGISRNGHADLRLPNTSNLSFDGIESEAALILLDKRGVCCSAGSACTSGSVHPSHVLKAMGLSNEMARASLRFSVGRLTTTADIDAACKAIPEVVSRLREMSPAGSPVLTA